MVNYSSHRLDDTFAALSDPTRRAMLARLSRGGATVTELARPFEVSLPAISKHLRVLEDAGLISRRRDGRIHHLRLETRRMHEAEEWIIRYRNFWEQQFAALEEYLQDTNSQACRSSSKKKKG